MSATVKEIMDAINRKPTVAGAYFYHCWKQVSVWKTDEVALGYMMRKLRIAQSVSLRAHARKLKWSAPYVSDLELGRRGWSENRVALYIAALPQMPEPPSLLIRKAGTSQLTVKKLAAMGIKPQETVLS